MKYVVVIVLFISIFALSVSSLFGLYTNFNSSNRYGYGRGHLTVSSCQPAGHQYICTGDFRQYGGMVEANNLSLSTAVSYAKGTDVDVYAHYKNDNNLSAQNTKLETSFQRRSVANNLGYFVGCLTPIFLGLYFIVRRTHMKQRANREVAKLVN